MTEPQVIVHVERPARRDIMLAVKQILADEGVTAEKILARADEHVKARAGEKLDYILKLPAFMDLVVKTVISAVLNEKEAFHRGDASGHHWHDYLRRLINKAIADNVLADIDVKVSKKSTPITNLADKEAALLQAYLEPGEHELALRKQKLRKTLASLDEVEAEIAKLQQNLFVQQSDGSMSAVAVARHELQEANNNANILRAAVVDIAKALVY
jgi:hypothetical protein